MIKNADGYNDPTVDKAFSNVLKKPASEQELKALARLKKLMRFLRFTAGEFGFEIEERIVLCDKRTGKIWR
ncbi:hypothetical protein [Mitsuokella multacida]|uniref:hypothetical protein n=1 Tax=Mitsuokella multacida TaxID=52226 RepID=UPI003F5E5916